MIALYREFVLPFIRLTRHFTCVVLKRELYSNVSNFRLITLDQYFKWFLGSTKYVSQYLDETKAHDGAIMAVKWNPFHPDVYATSGQVRVFYVLLLANQKLGLVIEDLVD